MHAARAIGTTFGVMCGLGGVRHGVGELQQGNQSPNSLVFDSWSDGPIATYMDGEPAFSLVPNLLVTGILTVALSITIIWWSIYRMQHRRGPFGLILLSVGLFLVGGGFGPPIVGLLAGVGALLIDGEYPWWQAHVPSGIQRLLVRLWPWVFGLSFVAGLFVFIASLILVYAIDFDQADLVLGSFYVLVVSLLTAVVTGIAFDARQRDQSAGVRG